MAVPPGHADARQRAGQVRLPALRRAHDVGVPGETEQTRAGREAAWALALGLDFTAEVVNPWEGSDPAGGA